MLRPTCNWHLHLKWCMLVGQAATVPAAIVVAHANLGTVANGLLAELYLLTVMFASSEIRDPICFTLRDDDLLCCWL